MITRIHKIFESSCNLSTRRASQNLILVCDTLREILTLFRPQYMNFPTQYQTRHSKYPFWGFHAIRATFVQKRHQISKQNVKIYIQFQTKPARTTSALKSTKTQLSTPPPSLPPTFRADQLLPIRLESIQFSYEFQNVVHKYFLCPIQSDLCLVKIKEKITTCIYSTICQQ